MDGSRHLPIGGEMSDPEPPRWLKVAVWVGVLAYLASMIPYRTQSIRVDLNTGTRETSSWTLLGGTETTVAPSAIERWLDGPGGPGVPDRAWMRLSTGTWAITGGGARGCSTAPPAYFLRGSVGDSIVAGATPEQLDLLVRVLRQGTAEQQSALIEEMARRARRPDPAPRQSAPGTNPSADSKVNSQAAGKASGGRPVSAAARSMAWA